MFSSNIITTHDANDNIKQTAVTPDVPGESAFDGIDVMTTTVEREFENLSQGVKTLIVSAERGCPVSMLHLSECYAQGHLVPLDIEKSRQLLQEAARRGNEVARRMHDKDAAKWGLPIISTCPGKIETALAGHSDLAA